MKITRTGQKGINLIKSFEGFFTKPYLCPAKVPTIGYGTTIYPSGKKVSLSDPSITEAQAIEYLKFDLIAAERQVDGLTRDDVNQNQFDALVSFVYNLGAGALKSSTLLKRVNQNPTDKRISIEFAKWINANGKPLKGLIRRRSAESQLYFS